MDVDGKVFACGRDPYFPAWQDVLQLNAFSKGMRKEAIKTVSSIAEQCDGMRCDMAMLLLSDVYARTWGEKAGVKPNTEYWSEVISAVKKKHPDTVFIAETYWDMEWELLQLGFDYCYDKRLYDRLVFDTAEGVRLHLLAEPTYQDKADPLYREPRRAEGGLGFFARRRHGLQPWSLQRCPGQSSFMKASSREGRPSSRFF